MKADDLISTLTWKYLFDCCNAASSQVSIKFLWFLQKQVRWITKGIIVLIMSWFDYKPSLKLFFFRFYFAETVLAFLEYRYLYGIWCRTTSWLLISALDNLLLTDFCLSMMGLMSLCHQPVWGLHRQEDPEIHWQAGRKAWVWQQ